MADLRSECVHSVDLGREIQGTAGRSEHSAVAARLSFVLSAGIDIQGRGRHRCVGKRGGRARTINIDCVPAIQIGNVTFHNWKKTDRGALNFVQALTESCDTWFYQVGIKTGAEPIIDWALKLGFGAKCGIPLRGEAEGRVPNDEYMKATHGRKLLNGDIANLSIGQGDLLVTPLQMAQAMAIVANGGTFYQTRLVQQVQTVDNEIVTAYQVRAKRTLDTVIRDAGAIAHRDGRCSQRRRRHRASGEPR